MNRMIVVCILLAILILSTIPLQESDSESELKIEKIEYFGLDPKYPDEPPVFVITTNMNLDKGTICVYCDDALLKDTLVVPGMKRLVAYTGGEIDDSKIYRIELKYTGYEEVICYYQNGMVFDVLETIEETIPIPQIENSVPEKIEDKAATIVETPVSNDITFVVPEISDEVKDTEESVVEEQLDSNEKSDPFRVITIAIALSLLIVLFYIGRFRR